MSRSPRCRRAIGVVLAVLTAAVWAGPVAAQGIRPDTSKADRLVQEGKFGEAAELYGQLTKELPNSPRAWFMYGYCLHGDGQIEAAIAAHRKAATFPQVQAVATYNLGCAYALLGRSDDAFASLNEALELGGVDADQWRGDSDLESLRGDARWKDLMSRVENPPETALRFWVGEWDVYTKSGAKAGENSITLRDNGRVVYESWTSANGGVGESFNYFEPVSRKWKQFWVDGTGNVIEMAGTFSDGALRFVGDELYEGGRTVKHRTTLTPLDGGRVRQFIENSQDGTTWSVAYDFIYVPKGEPFKSDASADAPL